MISRGKIATWQSLAGFEPTATNLFLGPSSGCKLTFEALPSRTRRASKCQNRYPSPSRRSGQNFLTGSTWFGRNGRSIACFDGYSCIVIAYQGKTALLEARSDKLHNFRGNTQCKRNSHSLSSQPLSDCRPVRKVQTSNAQPLVVSPAVWSVTRSIPEAASRAASLVPVSVRLRTTSTCNTSGASPVSISTIKGRPGISRGALFAAVAIGRPDEEPRCSRRS